MSVKTVRLLKGYGAFNSGERCGLPEDVAAQLVAHGYAEPLEDIAPPAELPAPVKVSIQGAEQEIPPEIGRNPDSKGIAEPGVDRMLRGEDAERKAKRRR